MQPEARRASVRPICFDGGSWFAFGFFRRRWLTLRVTGLPKAGPVDPRVSQRAKREIEFAGLTEHYGPILPVRRPALAAKRPMHAPTSYLALRYAQCQVLSFSSTHRCIAERGPLELGVALSGRCGGAPPASGRAARTAAGRNLGQALGGAPLATGRAARDEQRTKCRAKESVFPAAGVRRTA